MKKSICLVGAGYLNAVNKNKLCTSQNIIEETVLKEPKKFPVLDLMYSKCKTERVLHLLKLNTVWSNLSFFVNLVSPEIGIIIDRYNDCKISAHMKSLLNNNLIPFYGLSKKLIESILGLELVRMLAYQYSSSNISIEDNINNELLSIITSENQTIFITPNYDISLESTLERHSPGWKYFIDNVLKTKESDAKHIVLKPHGSLNLKFTTQFGAAVRHSLSFVSNSDVLKTITEEEIGLHKKGGIPTEIRPSIIGFFPDKNKFEVNVSAAVSDINQDYIKVNVCALSLSLQNADSIYILCYSMPPEDTWIWNRIKNIQNLDIQVMVASGGNTEGIIAKFKSIGFRNVDKLTSNGKL